MHRIAAVSLAACLAVGCADAGPPAVSGSVTVDGQPLAHGTIQFLPLAGDAPSEAARIEGGKFKTSLQPTKYRVQIYAPREANAAAKLDQNGPGGGPTVEETLPMRYNVQSGLTLEVTATRSDVKFDLKSR
jgi:hypothetical protein